MEIHSVLPEERVRDPKGDTLPWGYRYPDSARNVRQPEESGPFGRNRSLRTTGSRTPRARTGTTPVRQKENTAVAEFGRLFAREQAKEEERTKTTAGGTGTGTTGSTVDTTRIGEPEAVPTECLLYGYAGKRSEWKVLSKFESVVSPGYIVEDYPREDTTLFLSSNSPMGRLGSPSVVARRENLSREAIRKSRIYSGGAHWIKVTFDSYQAAERACFYSPLEIDGYMVHCEMWQGKGPGADVALPRGPAGQEHVGAGLLATGEGAGLNQGGRARTFSAATGRDSALAGFERAMQTLPRGHTVQDTQYGQPEDESASSTTASSATATAVDHHDHQLEPLLSPTIGSSSTSSLRSRSVPNLASQDITSHQPGRSEYMTHIKVKKAVLRPISEALPPQPSFAERAIRGIPVVGSLVGGGAGGGGGVAANNKQVGLHPTAGTLLGVEGPLIREDGSWDPANGWYWSFWRRIDDCFGTDMCGIKDD
ncbi:hypothetical protein PV08_04569 [Exophiala spinifera]|uniref:Uncharacterized protein n=1 Tax=Exophiala spinifera TaxID=91928 RepID=A0A0D2BFJ1_9EURO|nr:uncharacterized protein PV08_04569 [Exophiala spinifera]KIW17375.1 hypothetical protein PV08_04569 [Exophiala spinifera]